MSERVEFWAHVDRMELQSLPMKRGDRVTLWNEVCSCDECRKAYARVRVTVEIIEPADERGEAKGDE